METKNPQELFTESAKVAEKWINEANSTLTEIYNKQINLASGFYNTFFNSMLGTNPDAKNNELDFSDFLSDFKGSNMALANPFLFLSFLNKVYKQALGQSTNLMALATKGQEQGQANWDTFSKKFKESIESQFETLKNIQGIYFDSRYTRMDISVEANKNILTEINNQFNLSSKQVKEFWTDVLKLYTTPAAKKEEATFTTTSQNGNGVKKPSRVIA
jgi:hypothetical protein